MSIIKSMENKEWVGKKFTSKKSISFLVLILFTEVLFGDDVLNSINSHKEKFSEVALRSGIMQN